MREVYFLTKQGLVCEFKEVSEQELDRSIREQKVKSGADLNSEEDRIIALLDPEREYAEYYGI